MTGSGGKAIQIVILESYTPKISAGIFERRDMSRTTVNLTGDLVASVGMKKQLFSMLLIVALSYHAFAEEEYEK